jgi:hypothetical protein
MEIKKVILPFLLPACCCSDLAGINCARTSELAQQNTIMAIWLAVVTTSATGDRNNMLALVSTYTHLYVCVLYTYFDVVGVFSVGVIVR